MTGNKKIVLCATQRCGSTLLCEDMRNTQVLGYPEEYYIPWDVLKPNKNWERNFKNQNRNRVTENGVFSAKVMLNYLPRMNKCFETFAKSDNDEKLFGGFYKAFENATWVYVYRENTAKQAISRLISKQTGINHATKSKDDDHFAGNLMKGYDEKYNQDVKYSFDALQRNMDDISRENILWRRFFDDWGIKPLVLKYEDVVKSFPEHLRAIAAAADIELSEPFVERKMVKLSNQVNKEWYRRFTDDMLSAISGDLDRRSQERWGQAQADSEAASAQ